MAKNRWEYPGSFSSEILSDWIGPLIEGILIVYLKENSLLGPYAAKFIANPPDSREVPLVAGEGKLDDAIQLAINKGFIASD